MPKRLSVAFHPKPASGFRANDKGSAFEPGQRVFHQKFGSGKVVAADGNKLEIAFEKAGTKMVMGSFVEAV